MIRMLPDSVRGIVPDTFLHRARKRTDDQPRASADDAVRNASDRHAMQSLGCPLRAL